jgi:hypothetical protein
MSDWQPIETVPEGVHVLLYWQKGEKGIGGMECATVYREPAVINTIGMAFWTHGGPNAGSDWDSDELPTHWMPLPDPPAPSSRSLTDE